MVKSPLFAGAKPLVWVTIWLMVISAFYYWTNRAPQAGIGKKGAKQTYRIGYLPVTCHLTCPVTNYINKSLGGDGLYQPVRFSGWPELKETFLSGGTQATFILAPMAIALREQGVPIKVVYLGHRDGTAVMVHKDSSIRRMEDLRGKRVAIPNRFSNQWLLIFRALQQAGMTPDDIRIVEMPPPDMPAALETKSVDAISSGEPFMGQTELDGYGRVLWLTKDVWPNFISCVLAVHEDMIKNNRAAVQELVDGIARSGLWLDQTPTHRMEAADFVAKEYYNQNPRLLAFVLSKPPDRVKYTDLIPLEKDFAEIEALGKAAGTLRGTVGFADYVDPSFAASTRGLSAYHWEPKP